MCSVCGIVSKEPDLSNTSTVLSMLRRMHHRGPDGCGVHTGGLTVHATDPDALERALREHAAPGRVLLAQSRLAITGARDAHQPLVSPDGRLALAHNGEVYNHRELSRMLGHGTPADTDSDSETVLRVLEHHHTATGGDLVEAMRRTVAMASGMYVLAATDGTRVVLVRDAIGKKPLYYVSGARCFAFASERKALVAVARAESAPIERLLPGELLTCGPDLMVSRETVEHLSVPAVDTLDMETATRQYQEALEGAIRRRTAGLTRAAVLFSGGVDSVLVARLLQQAGVDVTGYVAGVNGSSDVQHAVQVAKEMGLPVDVSLVDEALVEAHLPRILDAAELHGPMMAEVSIPMWFASKAAHEDGHRVIFTGQAADELFAGYDWYRTIVGAHGGATLHARLWEDVRALPLDTLEREDRITMAWSLEMRAPFLDADVIRAAMRMAPSLKITGPDDVSRKHPHREVALRVGVPRSVAYREKVPAQDGASVHELLERVAARRFPDAAPDADVPDFGSNYRYRDAPGTYGSRRVRALLAAVVAENGIVVAERDGAALTPARQVAVAVKVQQRA